VCLGLPLGGGFSLVVDISPTYMQSIPTGTGRLVPEQSTSAYAASDRHCRSPNTHPRLHFHVRPKLLCGPVRASFLYRGPGSLLV
jgi:hypothetical protein